MDVRRSYEVLLVGDESEHLCERDIWIGEVALAVLAADEQQAVSEPNAGWRVVGAHVVSSSHARQSGCSQISGTRISPPGSR